MQTERKPRLGLTLVELLVVIAIIGVIAGLTLPAVQRIREASQCTQCANNLRQLGLAAHNHLDTFKTFPAGMRYQNGTDPYLLMSWLTQLLPYMEQQALWSVTQNAYKGSASPLVNPPHVGLATVMDVFVCPADWRADRQWFAPRDRVVVALTSYLGVEGRDLNALDGVLYRDSRISFAAIRDGLSQTVFAGERPPSADFQFGWWYAGAGQQFTGSADMILGVQEINVIPALAPKCPNGPYSFGPGNLTNQCDMFHFWSLHAGGANFLYADGSVHFLPYSASSVLPALASRDGGETLSALD